MKRHRDTIQDQSPKLWLCVPILLAVLSHPTLAQSSIQRIQEALTATVTIEIERSGINGSQGSGFVQSSDGVIVTAAHVVEGMRSGLVRFQNGREIRIDRIIFIDDDKDLAVIKVAGSNLPTIPVGDSDNILAGQEIRAIGAPLGLEFTVSEGIVSAKRVMDGVRWIQITAPVSPGNSGGPVITIEGQVIGVVSFYRDHEDAQNLNFAAPINYVLETLSVRPEPPPRPTPEPTPRPTPEPTPPGISESPAIEEPDSEQDAELGGSYLSENWGLIAVLLMILISLPLIAKRVSNTDYWEV